MATTRSSSTKLHLVMFPGFAFGHMVPYLALSNKLAEKGHSVSFVMPKGAQSRLEPHNKHPNLIRFFTVVVPHVDGLPEGAETTSDARSLAEQSHIVTAYDLCKDQLRDILTSLSPKPHYVVTDFGCWVPSLARPMGIKTVMFSVVSASIYALALPLGDTGEGTGPDYPSTHVKFRANEADEAASAIGQEIGSGMSIQERIMIAVAECDVIAIRTCKELEGKFCDYLSSFIEKPIHMAGPFLDDPSTTQLEEKWSQWLSKFEPRSVVYCAFGSQVDLDKDQYHELLLGFESCGYPFLVALPPPRGCSTIEEAFPQGFEERTRGKGWVYGGWAPQAGILSHPSVGCFVSHCGFGSMWESLLSDCQTVLVPFLVDQILNTRLLVEELKVAVEVERLESNRWISKENLSSAIKYAMDETDETTCEIRKNHADLKNVLSRKGFQESYMEDFIQTLQDHKN